ncbi:MULTISPECIES: hypothetical protein [unclassified Variovorax]|uniref:hypothetical protein n=1 Tax=unclassified Variovorax TaxID=663243 RepID=UPI0011AED7B2|nr:MULTISPECIES: hypothetical protein [unclassified Variovorax]
MALRAGRELRDLGSQVVDLHQHPPRVMQHGLDGGIELHALGLAVQELGADAFFELIDPKAGRGKTSMRAPRRGASCALRQR